MRSLIVVDSSCRPLRESVCLRVKEFSRWRGIVTGGYMGICDGIFVIYSNLIGEKSNREDLLVVLLAASTSVGMESS